jgi:hypothetical protein
VRSFWKRYSAPKVLIATLPGGSIGGAFVWSETLPGPHYLGLFLFLFWFCYTFTTIIIAGRHPVLFATRSEACRLHIAEMERDLVIGGHIIPRTETEIKLVEGTPLPRGEASIDWPNGKPMSVKMYEAQKSLLQGLTQETCPHASRPRAVYGHAGAFLGSICPDCGKTFPPRENPYPADPKFENKVWR